MPTWIVEPFSIRRVTWRAMARDDLVRFGHRHFEDRLFVLDNDVDVLDVDKAVAQGARHLRVDLGDDQVGGLGRRADGLHRHAQRAKAKRSGGVTWISATSSGIRPLRKSSGISDRKIGV